MKNEEAKALVDSAIKFNKKKKNQQIRNDAIYPISLINIIAAIPGGLAYLTTKSPGISITLQSFSSAMALYGSMLILSNSDILNLEEKDKIKILKKFKNELKNGVNRFEDIDVKDFDESLIRKL